MKRILFLMILIGCLMIIGCNEQEIERAKKDSISAKEGLNRILEVYSSDGKELKEYKGKFDIEWGDGGKVKFDLNGQRVIIYNAIVICEEIGE